MHKHDPDRIRRWLIRMVSWDGVLPAVIWSSPLVLRLLMPQQPIAIEAAAIFLPMAAFFIRFKVGKRHIATNACGKVVRGFQLVMLCIGIFILVMIDAVMILAHIVPRGIAINTADKLVFAAFYLTYLGSMAIAMYPGTGQRHGAVLDAAIAPSHSSLAAASASFGARRIAPPLP